MANPNKQSAPKPTDPLELMKQQGDDGKAAGTPVAPPAREEAPTVVIKAPPPTVEEVPEAPKPPPPPAVVHPRFRVLEDRRVIIEQGRVYTWLRRGAEVSAESHDVESLREQGVKLEAVTERAQ